MNAKNNLFILFVILAQVLAACGTTTRAVEPTKTPPPTPTLKPADPAAVVQGFYKAYNEGNIEAAMAFIADDIKCRGHCYFNGKESFQSFIEGEIKNGAKIDISDLSLSQDKVIFNYKLYRSGRLSATGVDSIMQIKDGKIVYLEIN